jgi:tetratricopeptide (TPR) repeat protein
MSSLIGYLQSIEGYSFEEFMADAKLWQGFDEYESETDDGNLAKRRTKALIAKQIQAQSEEVKFLLSVLAFIEKRTLREVLELFFKTPAEAAQAISRLTTHRLATVQVNSRGFHYYELHTYFLEQSRKHLLINIENWFLHNGFAYSDRAFKKGYELHLSQQYDLSLELSEFVEKIIRLLGGKSAGLEIAFALGATLINKSDSLRNLSEYKDGFKNIIEAIEIFDDLIRHHENDDLKIKLAMALYTYGVLLTVTNHSNEAIDVFEESIVILRNFIKQGKKELRIELTMSLVARAGALSDLNKSSAFIDKHSQDSISNYDEAILILRQLIKREKIPEAREDLLKNLAMGLLNKGFSLIKFNRLSEANSSCTEAINILLKLLENNHKNAELLNCLAVAYRNKALALEGEAKYEEAMESHNNAVSTLHKVYTEFKMIHVFPNFIRVLFARFAFCISFNLINEASLDIVTAAESLNIYLQTAEIPESLKQSAIKQFCEMSVFLREFPQEVREQIYNNTNKVGEMLRLIVEDRAFGI